MPSIHYFHIELLSFILKIKMCDNPEYEYYKTKSFKSNTKFDCSETFIVASMSRIMYFGTYLLFHDIMKCILQPNKWQYDILQ